MDDDFDANDPWVAMRLEPEERSDDALDAIWKCLHGQPHLISRYFKFSRAHPDAIRYFCKHIRLVSVRRSTLLCRQGEVGSSFYVLIHGSAEVLHHPVRMVSAVHARIGVGGEAGAVLVSSADRSRLGCRVGVLTPGMVFGELSACGEERDSSVVSLGALSGVTEVVGDEKPSRFAWAGGHSSGIARLQASGVLGEDAIEDTHLFQIDLNAYSRCAPATITKAEQALRRRVETLMALDLFGDWPTQELGFFSRWMTELHMPEDGEVLYAEGEPVDTIYFVLRGSVGLQCAHPVDPRGVLNLHHVNAPSFCGEDEVMQGIEQRVHTCVSTQRDTVVAMLPARVFQLLICSQYPAQAYKSAAKLAKIRAARTDWYDIRMSLGDSAAVPFSFLDHSQTKLLGTELYDGPQTRDRQMSRLFTRVLSGEDGPLASARKSARGMGTARGAGAGAGAGAGRMATPPPPTPRRPLSARRSSGIGASVFAAPAAPPTPPMQPRSASVQKLVNNTRERTASDPPELSAYDRFYSGTYHAPATPDSDENGPARPSAQHAPPAVPPLDLIGTPRVDVERPSSPMDWNRQQISEAEFQQKVTKTQVATELRTVMKAVTQFKNLLHRRRERKAREAHADGSPASHRSSPHLRASSPFLSGSLDRPSDHADATADAAHPRPRRRGHRRTSSHQLRPNRNGSGSHSTRARPSTSYASTGVDRPRMTDYDDPDEFLRRRRHQDVSHGAALARTGSMGAKAAVAGPRVGSGFLRMTKSHGDVTTGSSGKRVPRRLPSIGPADAAPPITAVPVVSPAGSGTSPSSATSVGSGGSVAAARRSARSLARSGSRKPEPLRKQLLKARAGTGNSPASGGGSPAGGRSPSSIGGDSDRSMSPATMRARDASARRRGSITSTDAAAAAAAAASISAQRDPTRRSWSPARAGATARDLGSDVNEDGGRRARLSVALGAEAQATLVKTPPPGSPAAALPARARRASIAARQRRSSTGSQHDQV